MISILGSLFVILVYVIKIALFVGFIMLISYFPSYLRMLWVRLLNLRNRLIINLVVNKRIKYRREKLGTDDPLAWAYESNTIYNTYQDLLPVIIDKGGGNCCRCHTLTLPNILCPKCGNFNITETLEYYHEDVKKYVAEKNGLKRSWWK